MKKTKLSSILLLSAAFLLAACNERTPTPAASSKTEPPASSSVVPAGTSSAESTPVVSSSEDTTPVVSSSEDTTPVISSSEDTTPVISSSQDTTPAASSSEASAEVVLTVEINGTVVNQAAEADPGDNAAVYKITLAVGDKLVIKGNGVALTVGEGSATEFTCKVAGEHTVYVNSGYVVWVTEPTPAAKVLTVEINGTVVNQAAEADPGDNAAVYKITLAVGDKLVIKGDGNALPVGGTQGTEFTCTVAGEHTVYVNKKYEVWVTEPAVEHVVTATVNGEAITLTNAEPTWSDIGVYDVKLEKGDKIAFYLDGTVLHLTEWDGPTAIDKGTPYEAPWAGTYRFGINASKQLWMGELPDKPESVRSVKVNGAAVSIDPLEDIDPQNYAEYLITLKVGDKLELLLDGEALPVGGAEGAKFFTCTVAGEHHVYVNKQNIVYVSEPAPAAKVLTVEKNGAVVNQAAEADPGDNAAVYKITLAVNDKLVIKGDGVALPLGDTEATEFTCKVAGEHTVYVNKQYKVYVTEPVAKAEVTVNLGAWVAEGQVVFAQSWKEGYANLVTKVVDGKFSVIEGCDGFLLACCKPGSESLIWEGDDKTVVKQTDNLALDEGVLTYTGEDNVFEWIEEKEVLTATASYSGTTTNLDGTNQAALLGLDNAVFSVVGEKLPKQQNNVGLNKDGTIRLYANQCVLILKGLTADIQSIKIVYSGTIKATVSVGDTEIEEGDDSVYEVNAEAGTEIRLQFNGSSGQQAKIRSIEISYTA
ncbi:MAG: hypothetical protein SPL80_03460 [Bacilli bacterium]|nr:hypothetical protein [Bacilli bacterium]